MEKTFTSDNCNNLKSTCEKIIGLLNENVDGSLMATQLISLGENIKDFTKNPIIKNSGIINQ